MHLRVERKIEVNKWIINARWFYVFGILSIGFLTKVGGRANTEFTYLSMIGISLSVLLLNLAFLFYIRWAKKDDTDRRLDKLGCAQLVVELAAFIYVMHQAGGIDSISYIFFFLPIVSSSFLFGFSGAFTTALVSGLLINFLVIAEYSGLIPHISRYATPTIEYSDLTLSLIKTLTISIFYLIVGIFSGVAANMLFKREDDLRRKTKEASREKNRIASIIANMQDPVIFIDQDNCIEIFNKAAEDILLLDEEAAGQEIKHREDLSIKSFKNIIKRDFELTRSEEGREEINLTYHGRQKHYKIISAPVKDEHHNYGHIKIFYDLTREKMVDNMKSEFISIAAHQLRTPLSGVKWMIKMLLNEELGPLNKDQKDVLSKGYKSNERMVVLIDDLLSVSHIEGGKFDLNIEGHDFNKLIDDAVYNVSKIIEKKDIKFDIKRAGDRLVVRMDKAKIALVLDNLLDNAIKYTPVNGRITLSVERDKNKVKISVKDDGIGIPEADMGRLFSKFFRASNARKVITEGNGLGLYIAKNIINKHGGKIYAVSHEGRGTTFVFILPLKQ